MPAPVRLYDRPAFEALRKELRLDPSVVRRLRTDLLKHFVSDEEALVLALFAHGRRRTETIANAIGLPASDAAKLLESCIEAGWISGRKRITDLGLKELGGLRSASIRSLRGVPRLGLDEYYPVALRGRGNG